MTIEINGKTLELQSLYNTLTEADNKEDGEMLSEGDEAILKLLNCFDELDQNGIDEIREDAWTNYELEEDES